MGIYPAGHLVRLDTSDVAVVLRAHAPVPWRPRVRVVLSADGRRLEHPHDVNLWERHATETLPSSIVAPVDAAALGLDPLSLMQ
jgi:hypothetical protein